MRKVTHKFYFQPLQKASFYAPTEWGHEADHRHPALLQVTKQWIYTPTTSYVYMACCLSTSDNFMLMITLIEHHVIKVYGGIEVCLQALLTLPLDRGECSASC